MNVYTKFSPTKTKNLIGAKKVKSDWLKKRTFFNIFQFFRLRENFHIFANNMRFDIGFSLLLRKGLAFLCCLKFYTSSAILTSNKQLRVLPFIETFHGKILRQIGSEILLVERWCFHQQQEKISTQLRESSEILNTDLFVR